MWRNGFVPLGDLMDTNAMVDFRAHREDLRNIVRGDGGGNKRIFGLGLTEDS